MDLEDFENDYAGLRQDQSAALLSAAACVEYLDAQWYINASRRARWMDLVGDYAGSEPFVLDGEALLQVVLDDPLLALARKNDPSFQPLHAIYTLERVLTDFLKRNAVFEIVFWEDKRHTTLHTGCGDDIVAARTLARRLLFAHISRLDIPVHTFSSISDPAWLDLQRSLKPMFVMTSDGGLLDKTPLSAERVLSQRVFLFELLTGGISVTLLQGSEFRDSKILSFVYESRLDVDANKQLLPDFWKAVPVAQQALDAEVAKNSKASIPLALGSPHDKLDIDSVLSTIVASSQNVKPELLYVFVAHILLLDGLSIEERAQSLRHLHPKLEDEVVHRFLPVLYHKIDACTASSNIHLDIDGRVFVALLDFIASHRDLTISDIVGPSASTRLDAIWATVKTPTPDVTTFCAQFPPPPSPPSTLNSSPPSEPFSLLPFENDVFDDELSSIHVDVSPSDAAITTDSHMDFNVAGTVFADTHHWHNPVKSILPEHLGGGKVVAKPVDAKARKKFFRREQRFMASLQRQAGTLTGAFGAVLKQTVIVPVGAQTATSKTASDKKKPAVVKQPAKKGKEKPLTSKEKLLRNIEEGKKTDQGSASQRWWTEQLEAMGKLSTSRKIEYLRSLLRNKTRNEDPFLAAEMRLFEINLELREWISLSEVDQAASAIHDRYTVSLVRKTKEIFDRRTVTPTVSSKLSAVLTVLGLGDYLESLKASTPLQETDQKLSFDFVKLVKSRDKSLLYPFMQIKEEPVVWQLHLFGEFMDRSMDSQADPKKRVTFYPDAWQREVLDCIDEESSLLVVAPTSAGKTFISYYAMEKVLRNDDEGILVYVAPTKALVTQIAAEVYARFSKDLKGRSCWAVHTRDYRIHDPQKCQILVTVPEMLAIMLLSPPLAKVWTPKIKRIILDEIHSIGQQEGGAVWEQIILLAPCPIIGLSATIGSPEIFDKWLESVQKEHGFKHRYIHHPHRYSHLRKFMYALQVDSPAKFQGLDSWKSTQRSRFLHPISNLSFGARSLPSDLALEASDALSLYQALQPVDPSKYASLEPTLYFSKHRGLLRQKDIIEYETVLKDAVSALVATDDSHDASSPLRLIVQKLEDPVLAGLPRTVLNTRPTKQRFRQNILPMICDLNSQGDLPAILFNFDRSECEAIAEELLDGLVRAEEKWRKSSPEWTRKIREWEAWKSRAKDRQRVADKSTKAKKNADEDAEPAIPRDASWESSFDPDDPSPQFSFASTGTSYSKSDLDQETEELARWSSTPLWAIDALKRGIAVHHSGMNKGYRSLVEGLFRMGFVRVIIATGTLALGINAPAKTSVFVGDSPYLSSLMFRQCAGRAGRRGYDLLGKVVFYGLSMDRVQRLILSKLPSLGGNFPLTSTLILRLFNLLDGSDNAPVAVKAIKSLVKLPQISFGSDSGRDQLLHHVRFSIDYLRRSRLLDQSGRPMNLFGIAGRLYYTEPSNLALVALLRNGVLHRICSQPVMIKAQHDLMLLMSHLFGRRYLPRSYTTDKNLAAIVKKSPSVVVLPPLPHNARDVLVAHDQEILRVFTGYAVVYASQYASQLGRDSVLPLSKQAFDGSASDGTSASAFQTKLRNSAIRVAARSAFVANSGHTDDFHSIDELTRTARTGLHLNEHAIPSLGQITAIPGEDSAYFATNAYLLDFYTHGQVKALEVANGIRRGDVWYLLQDFDLAMMTVCAVLEQLLVQAARDAEDAETVPGDLDSGYGTYVDPAEADGQDEDEHDPSVFQRPKGVSDLDWRVYEVVRSTTKEFNDKFRAMWA